LATFLTPQQIEQQYFQVLRSIKPSLNTNDPNSDFVIRGKALAGMLSGLYGDQAKVNNDTWVLSARPEAVILKGQDLGITQQPATAASSAGVQITGTNGTPVNPGDLTFLYQATNIIYTNTTGGTISGGVLTLSVQAQVTGQIGNIAAPDTLQVVSPPSGVNTSAALNLDMTNGADLETISSLQARILEKEQNPPAGGNSFDYPNFAFAADPSVRSAYIVRFGRGLGTVDVYITTGTTDIDTAVTNGLSIVRIPSSGVLATVQAYYNTHAPLTDCAGVFAPTQVTVPATVNYVLAQGLTLTSVPSDPVNNPLNLNCGQLIQREIGRVMYKLPVGGRTVPGFSGGFVVASDLEDGLDTWLSAVPDTVNGGYLGKIPILADRQIQKLNSPSYNYAISANQLAAPGTITLVAGV